MQANQRIEEVSQSVKYQHHNRSDERQDVEVLWSIDWEIVHCYLIFVTHNHNEISFLCVRTLSFPPTYKYIGPHILTLLLDTVGATATAPSGDEQLEDGGMHVYIHVLACTTCCSQTCVLQIQSSLWCRLLIQIL